MMPAQACWRAAILIAIAAAVCTDASPSAALESKENQAGGPDHRRSVQSRSTDLISSVSRGRFARDYTQGDEQIAKKILSSYGYFRKGKPLSLQTGPATGAVEGREERDEKSDAVRMFQSYFGLRQTGRLDEATLNLMKKNRCGVADIPEDNDRSTKDQETPHSFALLGSKWQKNTISWTLKTPTRQMQQSEQRRVMQQAFHVWSEKAPLSFQEVNPQTKADIIILFGARDHGDATPFDGKSKVLAHAYGPGNSEISGDAHFDDDETWTTDASTGADLLMVASHELGHSLGLAHSRDPGALMYPYYGMSDQLRLGDDDIKAIQSLYGTRLVPLTTTKQPTVTNKATTARPPVTTYRPRPASTSRPQSTTHRTGCSVNFDFVVKDQQDAYIGIIGDQAFRFTEKGLLPGNPVSLQTLFPGAPAHASAVFSVSETKTTYFVAENRLWRYTGSTPDNGFPRSLELNHFPEVIRFVLPLVDSSGNNRFFVFGSTYWLEYNFDEPRQLLPRAYPIPQYWPGVPRDVKYGIVWGDGYIYLVTPDSHVVLDHFRRPMNGGKHAGHPHWMESVCFQTASYSGSASNAPTPPHWILLTGLISFILVCFRQ